MSIYFALEYDENGVSKIVQKKDTSTRAINQRDFKFGPYKGSPITSPEDPDEGNNTGDFIDQMGTGTMGGNETDSFQRFIDRSGLNINQNKGVKDNTFINLLFKGLGIPVTAEGISEFMNNISKYLPETSPEIRRIRKFYSTSGPEGGLDFMNPSSPNYIPGMENYNIISGGLFKEPSVGLQDAFKERMNTISNTLSSASYMSKYGLDRGLTSEEIQSILDGTYVGPVTPLTKRYKNLGDVSTLEFNFKLEDEVDPGMATDTISTGTETVIDPNVDEEEGRPDDPRKDIRQKDLTGGPGKDFGPYSKQAPDYSNVKTGGGSPGQRSKDDKTGGDFAGKGSGNPFGR